MPAGTGAESANRHVTDPGHFLALGETIIRTHFNLLPSIFAHRRRRSLRQKSRV